MSIEEKLEELNIDKGQIIIFSIIILVIAFILYGLFSSGDDSDIETNAKIDVPQNRTITEYETKLEAYSKENQTRENKTSLDFDRDVFDDETTNLETTPRERLEAKVDSMLNSNKREKPASKKKITPKVVTTNSTNTKTPVESTEAIIKTEPENNININDFFVKRAPVKEELSESKQKSNAEILVGTAVVHNDQEVKNNGRVVLRLNNAVTIDGVHYKKNTFLYGFATFGRNRMYLKINNIDNNKVNFQAYDTQDGNLGVYIEGANIVGEGSKEVIDDALQEINVNDVPLGIDRSVRNIFRKKNREISVFLINDYEIILKKVQ